MENRCCLLVQSSVFQDSFTQPLLMRKHNQGSFHRRLFLFELNCDVGAAIFVFDPVLWSAKALKAFCIIDRPLL